MYTFAHFIIYRATIITSPFIVLIESILQNIYVFKIILWTYIYTYTACCISWYNTLRSIKKQASNIQLHNFETTVEEDLEILQLLDSKLNDSSITSYKTLESYRQQKLIVGLRRREHEVVSTLIDFADEKWMNLLNAKILNSDI